MFASLKEEMAPDTSGFRTLCPTCWTVWAASLQSVLDNFVVLDAVLEEALKAVRDHETRARLIGVRTIMKSFGFLCGVILGQRLLQHTDNLSKTLQGPALSAADVQICTSLTADMLKSIRADDKFQLFWAIVLQKQ